jgi:hypothetical protein
MDNATSASVFEYSSRLEFLYKVVEDTQNTIRFLDTKAAFCVTLQTAMMAAAFQLSSRHHYLPRTHLIFLGIFAVLTLFCISICVRVIFPTVHLQGSLSGAGHAGPTFFLVPRRERHRLRDTLGNQPPKGLEAAHAAYFDSVIGAQDPELVRSMCDEVVTISFLRQVKSDRLHLAIQFLAVTVLAFFIQLAI